MTDAPLVLRKLTLMREHLARVRRRRPATVELFRADVDLQDGVAFGLFVAIQEAVDTALHVVADEGWGVAGSYAEAFEILARHGVLTPALAAELSQTVGLRNRIAHGYASVDVERLYTESPAGLDALERYAAALGQLLAQR
jgi:uncharacterized protein YutE (UPF0331/DUF86 family)